ncbi:hypothetical protein SDRG_05841 [Saprolegnia diclina VS20]|uniref:Uncharacterized protein n=1 Tax=Saprolegnia diclina (strain VS20) TaxID=1156394 RepID=T0S2Z3_SAPDV|nr:hypothetical protein SDRG_05841 [Saprolegnia diclina VS20]EQC37022.1 hypothetical protein SDRG_05841 [Saprolegnia diclina VS20]|eukprot:XP_008609803.1 hypothetical protein SDRG_05841 [Saprolegnia diclina VS20]
MAAREDVEGQDNSEDLLLMVQTLHERGLTCSTVAMDGAAANGHLDVIAFLHAHQNEGCTVNAMDEAATNSHLEIVQFLHFNRPEGCTVGALDGAICSGHLDIVRFLIEHRTEGASPTILDDAVVGGHLDIVECLHHLGTFGCTVAAIDDAASHGHLDVVKFLLTNRTEGCTHDNVVGKALEYGHLRTAEYLLSIGYPFPISMTLKTIQPTLFKTVAVFRKPEMVDVVRLYVAHGLPWGANCMHEASVANNLPLVKFLHENSDGQWDPAAIDGAVKKKAWDVVFYLMAHCPMDISIDALRSVLASGHLNAAMHILQRRPELRDDTLLEAASTSHNTEATRLLLAAGIGKPHDCLRKIAGRRQHMTESNLLLPYCMDATNHLDNAIFLLFLFRQQNRRRATIVRLIIQELMYQVRQASKAIQLAPDVAARAATLLQAGKVVSWAAALVLRVFSVRQTRRPPPSTTLISDVKHKLKLPRLLQSKRKRA